MRKIALAIGAMCLLVVSAVAQSNTGSLTGTVSGPDGVLKGATVTVTDNKTGKEKTVTSSDEGTFTVPQLEIGTYTVKVTVNGFKTFTATELKIDVGREFTLTAALEVGDVKETISITAGDDVVNASTVDLSNTVGTAQIKELPLNGRNPLNLIGLQAGTAANGSTNTSINGQRTSFTNITRDGLNIQDNFIRANGTDFAPQRPSVDNTSEFTITTQNAGADNGTGASQIRLVTPRGANQYHGSLYEFNRNSALAANNFFNNANGIAKGGLNRNQFGGSISGPVPFLKDKLFFFFNYEDFRLNTAPPGATRTILLPNARNGLFTYTDNGGVTRTLNVLTTAGFAGVDPTIQSRILANEPTVGNSTQVGDQLNTTGLSFNQSANQRRSAYTARVDFDLSAHHTINGVYSFNNENNQRPDVDGANGFSTTPDTVQPSTNNFLAIAYRYTAGGSFTNEVRGGFFLSSPVFNRSSPEPAFFLNLPLISNTDTNFEQQGRFANYYNIQDNAQYIRGQHSIQFGGQVQFYRINPFGPGAFANSLIPTVTLGTNPNTPSLAANQFAGGISTTQLNNANSLLALLGGIVTGVNQGFNALSQTSGFVPGAAPNRHLNYENYALFGQDQWRVRPNLTFTGGLRYDVNSALKEPNGLALAPVIGGNGFRASLLDPNGTYDFISGNKFSNGDLNNLGPILGVAYTPNPENEILKRIFGDGKSVIRGGFRISYANDEFVRAADNALGGNQGINLLNSAINPATNTTQLNARLGSIPTVATPTFQVPRTFAQNNQIAGLFGTVFAIDPNLQSPRVLEYNLSYQRDIGNHTAIEIRYVGGSSSNLVRGTDINQVDIFNNGFAADFNRARQNLILSGGVSGAFNPAIVGSQPLTVFPNLVGGGLLTNSTVRTDLQTGIPADLAILYVQNALTGSVKFLANQNTGVVDVLSNNARYYYNSLQFEVRRRFSKGIQLQANYTFQKTLTDASGVGQTNFEPLLDNNNPGIEYARAAYDQTHVFNLNLIYELPFGKDKAFLNQGGMLDKVVSGWQVTSIVRFGTGAPLSIVDPRGTLNRAGRSGLQTALTSLTQQQIKDLTGIFTTLKGVSFINPAVIDALGRGAEGFGTTPFTGQVFFNNAPGTTGALDRAFINGPILFNWDASINKTIKVNERMKLQIRTEAFNVLNRANFGAPNLNINSTQFGRINFTALPERQIQFAARLDF